MPYKTPELTISPSVLKWARKTGGYTPEDLAHFLKRPLAAFLLVESPPEPGPPRDFRRAVGPTRPLSPNFRLVIRRARRLQRVACELMESMGISITSEIPIVEFQ